VFEGDFKKRKTKGETTWCKIAEYGGHLGVRFDDARRDESKTIQKGIPGSLSYI